MPMVREEEDIPLFADGFGFLLTNEDSVDDLNQRLKKRNIELEVDARRFRPNICVKGRVISTAPKFRSNNLMTLFAETNGAFCEDDWLFIKINGVIFR